MTTGTILAIASLILGGGVGVTLLKYLFAHAKKHQEIDDRLEWGDDGFTRNTEDHVRLGKKLDQVDGKVSAVGNGLKELLVKEGLRKPGQGLNGEH